MSKIAAYKKRLLNGKRKDPDILVEIFHQVRVEIRGIITFYILLSEGLPSISPIRTGHMDDVNGPVQVLSRGDVLRCGLYHFKLSHP
jgi:hypothetical protein